MPIIASDAVVITHAGPHLAGAVKVGTNVATLAGGRIVFTAVTKCEQVRSEHDVAWMYTTAGDLTLPLDTKILTQEGLRSGAELMSLRDNSAIGKSGGAWPLLEHLRAEELRGDENYKIAVTKSIEEYIKKYCAVSIQSHTSVFRVSAQYAAAFARTYPEYSPVGWGWVTPDELQPDSPLIGWRAPSENGSYFLSITEGEYRRLTFALLYCLGSAFSTDYQPKYAPAECELLLKEAPLFSTVQGAKLRRANSVHFELAIPRAYIVADSYFIA